MFSGWLQFPEELRELLCHLCIEISRVSPERAQVTQFESKIICKIIVRKITLHISETSEGYHGLLVMCVSVCACVVISSLCCGVWQQFKGKTSAHIVGAAARHRKSCSVLSNNNNNVSPLHRSVEVDDDFGDWLWSKQSVIACQSRWLLGLFPSYTHKLILLWAP